MDLPVTLNLRNRRCLIVGGGKVGTRKARLLHEFGAVVTVLSSSLGGELPEGIQYINARYHLRYLTELVPWLVVAATDVTATNQQIQADAEAANLLVMRVDDTTQGDIKGLMFRTQGDITMTVASGSPLISRYLLDQFTLSPDILTLAAWMKALREPAKTLIPVQAERAELWRRVFESSILEHLQAGDAEGAKAVLADIIGAELMRELPA